MIIWPVPRHRLHLHNSRPVSTQPYKGSRMDALRPPCKPRFLMLHHTPRSAAVHTDLSIHSPNPESAATPSASLPLPDPDNTICRPADPDTSPSACLCFHPHSTICPRCNHRPNPSGCIRRLQRPTMRPGAVSTQPVQPACRSPDPGPGFPTDMYHLTGGNAIRCSLLPMCWYFCRGRKWSFPADCPGSMDSGSTGWVSSDWTGQTMLSLSGPLPPRWLRMPSY